MSTLKVDTIRPRSASTITFGASGDTIAAGSGVTISGFGTTISNDANNRITTADGSGGLNAEANMTFDGSLLTVTGTIDTTHISVNAGGNATNPIIYVQSDTDTGIFFPSADTIAFSTGNGERLRIDSSGIDVTGTITFDGGTTSADLNFGDNDKAVFGAGNDLQIYHDGSNSNIFDFGTGGLDIRGHSNIWLRSFNTGETFLDCTTNGAVQIYHDGSKKFETTAVGATVTGNLSADGFRGNDNASLLLGNVGDLEIVHNGTGSFITENGAGDLFIQTNGNVVRIEGTGSTPLSAMFDPDDSVDLYFNNSKKFETTSSGVTITGTLTETSSIEYKENVQPLEFNEAIYNVNAVKYDRKDGSQKDEVGVIAEDLYEILPDLVQTKDGKPESVKYTKLTMYLLEALKKQNEEIKMLKENLNQWQR